MPKMPAPAKYNEIGLRIDCDPNQPSAPFFLRDAQGSVTSQVDVISAGSFHRGVTWVVENLCREEIEVKLDFDHQGPGCPVQGPAWAACDATRTITANLEDPKMITGDVKPLDGPGSELYEYKVQIRSNALNATQVLDPMLVIEPPRLNLWSLVPLLALAVVVGLILGFWSGRRARSTR